MRKFPLFLFVAVPLWGTIGNVRVVGVTSQQAVVAWSTSDSTICTVAVSATQNGGIPTSPFVNDVNTSIFYGSSSDNRPGNIVDGNERMFVVGQRTSQLATAGAYAGLRHYSRSLAALTPYYGLITCGASTAPFTFTTTNIPLGETYGDPWLSDPTHPGEQPWPEWLGGLTPESFIDPLTGTFQYRVGLRGNAPSYWASLAFGSAFNQSQSPCDAAGPWTAPCNVATGTGTTTVGNSQAPLVLRLPLSANNPWNSNYNSGWSLDQLAVSLTGSASSTNAAFRVMDICLSLNGGASCASSTQQVTLGTSSAKMTVGQADYTQFGVLPWLLDTTPRLNAQESAVHSGKATVTNNAGTYTVTNTSGDLFSLYWITGGNGSIRLSANNDACTTPPANTTSAEYRIASFTDGNNIVLASGTPPTGTGVYWCENNFTVMVWRDQAPTDGSSVTITAANMTALGSSAPSYPDNGAGTGCFTKAVYGGYFCLYGNLYWVNPAGPSVAYFGQPVASGADASGTPIANSWTRTYAPTPEAASIDQTANNLTFYLPAQDPAGGGPVVVQGVFTPTAVPVQPTTPQSPFGVAQIANAPVTSTTPYSVTWSVSAPSPWSMTWTNLTPQSTLAESIVNQMATFDPTFLPSYFSHSATGGWNCGLTGAASLGVFYFACYSIGGDTPAWIFAFSPGDGNPAHAGQAGGPRVIGAINTFNTPNGPVAPGQGALTGRSLHAMVETGETGWVAIDGNEYEPVNTSAASIPSSGVDCSTYGLPAGNDCLLIQIDSHTVGGVTGYEPYFASPRAPFLGTPGELRTTQVGDTACVAPTGVGYCSWANQGYELMTLKMKNYIGVNGAWVFQRKAYGAEKAATGPVTLWWESVQSSLPPTATGVSAAVQVWWNPLAGCAGSPDPHGDCLMQSTNEYHGHGEWRDGGSVESVNVPAWKIPGAANGFEDWPNVYQTMVGHVPSILGFPFANVTPNAAAGVNYVWSNPPFANAFGVPFQPDGGTHPNPAGANASPYEAIRAFDNYPVQGGAYDPNQTTPFLSVSGQLYRYRPGAVTDADDFYTPNSVAYINRKLMATGAACGSHPLIDMSNPSNSFSLPTDTRGSYEYCVARNSNECYPESSVGDIYVNCPGVVAPYCQGNAAHGGTPDGVGNDICVGNISKTANAIAQFTLDHTDSPGAASRVLASATSRVRMVSGFENNRLLPDNSWLLYRQEFLNYQRQEMWMMQNLPYPAPDSVNRGTFVAVPVEVDPKPTGLTINNAVVEFGYGEYAQSGIYYCTTRADICQANAISIPAGNAPFVFASETAAGLPCSSGCVITVPAISGRVLYYRSRYRDSSNNTLYLGPWQAQATP